MIGLGGAMFGGDESSSLLFPVVLTSHLVKDAVLARRYEFEASGARQEITLAEYFGQSDPDLLREALGSVTDITTDNKTGHIRVAVETKYPELSQQIVQEYLAQLEIYNNEKRRSTAGENAKYLAEQLEETQKSLLAAEDSLRDFRSANMNWAATTNPDILRETARLERQVNVNLATYRGLQEQYQIARLEAQKDIPIVRILDRPSLPTQKSSPHRLMTLVAVTLLTGFLTVLIVILAGQITTKDRGLTFVQLKNDVRVAFPRTIQIYGRVKTRITEKV
jgi:hypothetical protein